MFRRLLLVSMMTAGSLSAQAFEGILSSKVPSPMGGAPIDAKTHIKGSKVAVVMVLPAGAGPIAGEIRMIIDAAAGTGTVLLPPFPGMPMPSGAKGMKMTMNLNAAAGQGEVKSVALGTTQTIAGMRCEDYAVTQGTTTINMCLTTALGDLMSAMSSAMSGPEGAPSWARAFGGRAMAPLKLWDDKGVVMMEVTGVQRGTVPASMFVIPEGYMDMPGMGGGRP